jgi:uroporphyrinogen decarboxylase
MNKGNVLLPNRERFVDICHGKRPGDVSIIDWFNTPYPETPEEWVKQGAPEEIKHPDFYRQYFQYDHHHTLEEIISSLYRGDLSEDGMALGTFLPPPPAVPAFERKILSEDARHWVEIEYGGRTVEASKKAPFNMPKFLDFPVKDRATWNEYKKRLDPFSPGRWPSDWEAFVAKKNSEDTPMCLALGGFFGMPREWTGVLNLLYLFYDDPKLVDDMIEHLLYFELEIVRRIVKSGLRIDWVRCWEDMAYNIQPLISPAMFRKFVLPRYKQLADLLRSNGIDILVIDCDGNVNELLPIWFEEVGINIYRPLEVAARNDAIALRKKYGKDIIPVGNIDKRVFPKGKEAIREEVMAKIPFLLETGTYFPALDHSIPPTVSFENFRYFINLVREIAGMEKLPE